MLYLVAEFFLISKSFSRTFALQYLSATTTCDKGGGGGGGSVEKTLGIEWIEEKDFSKKETELPLRTTMAELGSKWTNKESVKHAMMLSNSIRPFVKVSPIVFLKLQVLGNSQAEGPQIFPDGCGEIWWEHDEVPSDFDFLLPSTDPNFYNNNNPVYCGLECFKLGLGMEKAGVQFANYFGALFYLAHLYHAIREEGLLEESQRWLVLEEAMQIHIDQLFHGELLSAPDRIYGGFLFRMGIPPQTLARGSKRKQPDPSLLFNILPKITTDFLTLSLQSNKLLDRSAKELEAWIGIKLPAKDKMKD